MTVANPDRTKTVRFAIDDPFLRFWFHYVLPFEGRRRGAAAARRRVVVGSVKERTPEGLRNVAREIDAVAVDDDGAVLATGSCKWTGSPLAR